MREEVRGNVGIHGSQGIIKEVEGLVLVMFETYLCVCVCVCVCGNVYHNKATCKFNY